MDKPYSNFAYAELNLSFNKELFVQEYDDQMSLLPTKKLLNLINWTTAITLPNNYKFDTI